MAQIKILCILLVAASFLTFLRFAVSHFSPKKNLKWRMSFSGSSVLFRVSGCIVLADIQSLYLLTSPIIRSKEDSLQNTNIYRGRHVIVVVVLLWNLLSGRNCIIGQLYWINEETIRNIFRGPKPYSFKSNLWGQMLQAFSCFVHVFVCGDPIIPIEGGPWWAGTLIWAPCWLDSLSTRW